MKRAFWADSAEQHPVVGDNTHRMPVDACESGDEGLAVILLELVEFAAVDDPRDDLLRRGICSSVGTTP
jgi:hypothetical protein